MKNRRINVLRDIRRISSHYLVETTQWAKTCERSTKNQSAAYKAQAKASADKWKQSTAILAPASVYSRQQSLCLILALNPTQSANSAEQ